MSEPNPADFGLPVWRLYGGGYLLGRVAALTEAAAIEFGRVCFPMFADFRAEQE